MTTYEDLVDATLAHGLMPLVVPQLKTITLGGAVAGLGIESTSFRHGLPHESVRRDGDPHRRRRGRHRDPGRRARRPLPRLPQLLRHARLRPAPGDRPAAGGAVRRGCSTAAFPTRQACTAADRRAAPIPPAARLPRRHRLRRRGAVPHHGRVRQDAPRPGLPRATTPGSRSSTAPSSSARRPPDRPRLPLALGHRLVLVLARAGRAASRWSAGSGRAASAAPTSTAASSPSTAGTGSATGSTGCAAGPVEEPVVQDVEIPARNLPAFLEAFHRDVGISPGVAVPAAAAVAVTQLDALPDAARESCTSTSGSGRRCRRFAATRTGTTG